MRLNHIVYLDETGRTATVRQMTVGEVRQLLTEHCAMTLSPVLELLGEHHFEAKAFLNDIVTPPDGETLDKLPFSELMLIDKVFMEANKAVFQQAAAMGAAANREAHSNSSIPSAQP